MSKILNGMTVAILADNGFEQSELLEPQRALEQAGAKTVVVSPISGTITGWSFNNWGQNVQVNIQLNEANPDDYDALLLPGGVMNPDKLRLYPEAIAFVRDFYNKQKPIAAICHGPWMLVEANIVKDKTITSWPSIRTDIINAGGHWVDQEVVVDNMLITSRKPDDIPFFNDSMITVFASKMPILK